MTTNKEELAEDKEQEQGCIQMESPLLKINNINLTVTLITAFRVT